MSPRTLTFLIAVATCAPLATAAQGFDEDVLQEDAFEDDPIGIGDVGDLGDVPRPKPRPSGSTDEGAPPEVPVREGEIVRAVPPVRETHHRVEVQLLEGLVVARHALRFVNVGSHDAPVRYRLAVPHDAEVAACDGCRTRWVRDERGVALEVLVPPLASGGEGEVTLTYVTEAPQRGGAVRWQLPPRGSDGRAAPAAVTVNAPGLLSPTVDGAAAANAPVPVDPWRPAEVTALYPTGHPPQATLWHFPCGQKRCARVRLAAGPRQAAVRDVLLLIDASPSTLGPARNRMGVAFAALLGVMPGAARVQAVAFAGRARPVVTAPTRPDRIPLGPLVEATRAELGAATRLEAAWPTVRNWVEASRKAGRHPLVLLLGDGGLTRGDGSEEVLSEAQRLGVPLHAVDLGDRPTRPALIDAVRRTGGLLVTAGAAAARAYRGEATAPLEERLRVLFAPVVTPEIGLRDRGQRTPLGALRAGEEIIWEGPVRRRPVLVGRGLRARARPAPDSLAHALARRVARPTEPREVHDLTPAPVQRTAALEPPPPNPLDGKGVPKATVRVLLRQRLVPQARACFRQDRRGRADHARRAEFVLRLAEREVIEARVEGDLPEDLRQCLLAAVDALEVPMFEGVVIVRYPVYTERAPEEPKVELEAPVADQVDAVTAGHPATPRTP